ncbi:hypothetical protein LEMLEM_LOCUS2674, partial [Lemmus lemmus]
GNLALSLEALRQKSPVLPSRPDVAQGGEAGENPSCPSLYVQKAHNDHPSPPTSASQSSPAPKTLPLPLLVPDVSPPQPPGTSPMLIDDFTTGRETAVQCPGVSHLEPKGRRSGQKGKVGPRDSRFGHGGGGMWQAQPE